jgi:hypothetical protein
MSDSGPKVIYATRFIAKEVDSDLMLYDPELDEVHILNATARAVYHLLGEGKTVTEIAEILRSRSLVQEGDDPLKDVQECIGALLQKGLIVEHPDL